MGDFHESKVKEVDEKHVIDIQYLQGALIITTFLEIFVRIYVWWSRREKDHPLRRVKGYTQLPHLSKKLILKLSEFVWSE